jgi:hypothetical protein
MLLLLKYLQYLQSFFLSRWSVVSVTDGGEGVCVDPGEKEAILEAGGPGLPGGGKGWQFASDRGGGET